MRRWTGVSIPIVVLAGVCSVASSHAAPRLELEVVDGTTSIRVETGRTGPVVLRETVGPVVVGPGGQDPGGKAAFVTWDESDGRRWFAYSRDWGASWSPARPLERDLRLLDGDTPSDRPMPFAPSSLMLPSDGRLFLVQFHIIGLPEWRQALGDLGAEVLQHFPHNAHIVRMDPDLVDTVARAEFVERVEPYHPWYRLEPALREWLDSSHGPQRWRVRVMALEWGPEGKARIAEAALAEGASVVTAWPTGHIIELSVDRDQLRAIAAHDDVMWIDRWFAPESDMNLVRIDGGTDWLENNFGYCGEGVRGEVLDSGIQDDHMDFDGLITHGGYNQSSHGTSTYGIVFGNGDRDGDGDATATGHMPCAQGIFADYGFLGNRFAHTQELKASPYFASFQTNSWGSGLTTAYTSSSTDMDDIIWRLDIAITQSQSNQGSQSSRPQAWAKNVISVGGIRHFNTLSTADDAWNGGASIGPAADGRLKPDLNYWYDSIRTTTTGNGYTSGFGGTSAATPEIAGVLGLFVQMWSENVWDTNPVGSTVFERQPHSSTIKALLINNSQQYPFSSTTDDLSRFKQGWGRPSVQIAQERAARSFVVDEEVLLQVGEVAALNVDVPPGEAELRVTMVYTDPPGTTSSSLHRINDVNLKVTTPSTVVYHGNVGLDVGNVSMPGGAPNGVDTVENVWILNPEAGRYSVEIEAVEVNQDAVLATPQDDVSFALVVTGGTGSLCDSPSVGFIPSQNPAGVGDAITFDSTASGGAGAPFTYAWDFNADGVIDSSEADPVHVYNTPYSGNVILRVRDAETCPATVEQSFEITGPDVRFHALIDLTEFDGNGNGALDPGEVWDVTLQLRNDGTATASSLTAGLAVAPQSPGVATVFPDIAAFGNIPPSGVATGDRAFRFSVGQNFSCGDDILFSAVGIVSVVPLNVYPDEVAQGQIVVGGAGPAVVFFTDGFETNLGWNASGQGEWQIGQPQGLGGDRTDPGAAFEGSQVMGNDLSGQGMEAGDYENRIIASSFESPPIDCSDASDVQLSFARWLNSTASDEVSIDVSDDEASTQIFFDDTEIVEQSWSQVSYDVSAVADGNASFTITFGISSGHGTTQSGWNVDDLVLRGVTSESCEPVARALSGATSGLELSVDGSGLQLAWQADCGGGSVYDIYRGDLDQGYGSLAAEPGFCNHAASGATLPLGTGDREFFLVVPSDGAFAGSYGVGAGGAPRAPAAEACHPQDFIDACAP